MIVFITNTREYRGATALEIVRELKSDAASYLHKRQPIRHFLLWSLNQMGDRIPPRELDMSTHVDDETLALTYLFLCDEYGEGRVVGPASAAAVRRE